MKRMRWWIVGLVLLLAVVLATAALAAGEDPLISLSYLTGPFKQQLLSETQTQIETQVAQAQSDLSQQLAAIDSAEPSRQSGSDFTGYVKYTLAAGESLYFSAGSEILLLSGSAELQSGSLTDSTAGVVVAAGGSLAANHLGIGLTDGSLRVSESVEILFCE